MPAEPWERQAGLEHRKLAEWQGPAEPAFLGPGESTEWRAEPAFRAPAIALEAQARRAAAMEWKTSACIR